MKRSRSGVGLAILVGLLFLGMLVINAPAQLMKPILQAAAPQLGIAGMRGTLWRGQANRIWVAHQNKRLALGELRWRLKAGSLLLLSPRVDVNLQGPGLQALGQLQASVTGAISGDDIDVSMPLAVLRTWYPLLLDGQLNLQLERVKLISNWPKTLQAKLMLESAGWRMGSQTIYLGDYQGEVNLVEGKLVADLTDRNARLAVTGKGELSQDGRYATNLYVEQGDDQVAPIYRFVEFIGKPEGDGMRIELNGRLSGLGAPP